MSDGITDSYRDQERGERYEAFLKNLEMYLREQTEESLNLLKRAADRLNGVPRGLMSGQTNLAQGLDAMLAKLLAQDKRTWGLLLSTAVDAYPRTVYTKLKQRSPFANQTLISVNYGMGFANIGGEIQRLLDNIIGSHNDLKIYDADRYLVAIPTDILKTADVTWLKCGIYGVKEPRKFRSR